MTELDTARPLIAAAGSLMTRDSLSTLGRFRALNEVRRRRGGELLKGASASLKSFLAPRIGCLEEGHPKSREPRSGAWPRYNLAAHVALELTAPRDDVCPAQCLQSLACNLGHMRNALSEADRIFRNLHLKFPWGQFPNGAS